MYEEYLTRAMVGVINAKQALSNYRTTGIKAIKCTAAYNIQQAIEYMMKYVIYNNNSYNEGKSEDEIHQIFTHNLSQLCAVCKSFDIDVPDKIAENAATYTSWEAESRYEVGFSVRTDSLAKAIVLAEQWLVVIKPLYKAKLKQVNEKLGFE